LVHCSDGWDRTSQIVSLAMILSDPYYRTINGFQLLIEKEWLSFGHQFHLRQGHEGKEKEEAPIFLQFLECVWNLTRLYPEGFEFNEEFLIALFDHSYSGIFGTFLLNNEKDRVNRKLWKQTSSLWLYLDQNKPIYINYWYNPYYQLVLAPLYMRHLKIWEGLFFRFDRQNFPSRNLSPKNVSSCSESLKLSSELNKDNPEDIAVYCEDNLKNSMIGNRSLIGRNKAEIYGSPLIEESN